ncbi:hypothetical cyanophage protein [Synechococcus phage S-RSM4]|uniref:Hypothetical cyanophage protein n=1 Tax=Synechococcus phage S-RSM4 TaxID=555387 RepID=C7BV15_9CAUD|nr:hypothetical cyanophage protein [Synechococcus phage S-RSM4]CAR63244.1 hypothetical cyanophage protein [Synechococcus phage S-RSM4]
MISLDARYHSYLHTDKCFLIDGQCERVIGYGWTDNDGAYIDGYYVLTNNHKLFYNLEEKFLYKEEWRGGRVVEGSSLEN